jgi:hypothetical protein
MATRSIRQTWKVNGVYTDVTSAVLSDSTAAYGVIRDDTGAVVVASGTAMTRISEGQYEYSFAEPAEGVAYTASVKLVYSGNTYYFEHDLAATSVDNTLGITYGDIRREIGRFLGYGRDPAVWALDANKAADVEDIIKSGARRAYMPPPLPGEKYAHEWSFLKPVSTLTVNAPYNTGTITIAAGVVTMTPPALEPAAAFPSWAADVTLYTNGGAYTVNTRDGNTQLTLDDTSATSNGNSWTYTLQYPSCYDLPTNFAMFDGPMTFSPDETILYGPIRMVSEYEVRSRLAENSVAGRPEIYAYRIKTPSYTTGTRYEVLFYPTPDDGYTLYYRYKINPLAIDVTNELPLGGDVHGELFLESCLSSAEKTMNDGEGVHTKRFWECLAASVSHDRRVSSPDNIGCYTYRDDLSDFDYHSLDSNLVTYTQRNGTVWP